MYVWHLAKYYGVIFVKLIVVTMISRKIFSTISLVVIVLFLAVTITPLTVFAQDQELTSTNFKILDPSVDSGGGAGDSASGDYSLLTSLANPTSDSRATSGSYAYTSGFPAGIMANVPKIICAETDTIAGSNCTYPNANGAQGECGTPGCYDRAKIEVDHQNNPVDTLYLVKFTEDLTGDEYYLTTSHTIDATAPTVANNYMTICDINGIDGRTGSGCTPNTDWQSTNVRGLVPGTAYFVQVRALSGNFTETNFSDLSALPDFTTEYPSLSLDIDIADSSGSAAETNPEYVIDLGVLVSDIVQTAPNRIWLDMNTNSQTGMTTYVSDTYAGLNLTTGSGIIDSEDEDLDAPSGSPGGYGLKTATKSQTALGPILDVGTNFQKVGANEVGNLTTSPKGIFQTNTAGANQGMVNNGRASIDVKALVEAANKAGNYQDFIYFTMVGTF